MKIFRNSHGEIRSGWIVTAVILLLLMGQLIAGGIVDNSEDEDNILFKILVTGIYSLITIGGGCILFKVIYRCHISEIGLIKKNWLLNVLRGLGAGAIAMGAVFTILLMCGQAEILSVDRDRLLSVSLIVEFISLCFTAFSEELLVRGFIMSALRTTRNMWAVILIPALIFSLFHLLNPGITAISYINTLLGGLLFSYMFIKSGSLWLPTGFHIAWNFLQGDLFGMNVSGNEEAAVFNTQMGSNNIITGGSYGAEGGLVVTLLLLCGFLYVRYLVKHPDSKAWSISLH